MTFLTTLTFLTTMFLIVLIPGPGTFAIVSKALSDNLTKVSFMILGMVIADLIFLYLAIFGLSTIAAVLGDLFLVVKYIGAIYLIYLGYKLLTAKEKSTDLKTTQQTTNKKSFLLGFAIAFSNPKVIIFYLSLVPTLVNIQTLTMVDIGILTLCVTSIICVVMFGYTFFAFRAKGVFQSSRAKERMNKVAGGTMVATGGILFIKE